MANRIVYRGKSIKLEEKDIEFPNGGISRSFPVVTHENGVIVVPIIKSHNESKIVLIRQWRPAMGSYFLEVPGGGILDGESMENAARREIMEEAGLVVESLVYLGKVFPAPGWDVESQDHFIAFCSSEVYEQPQDDSATIDRISISIDEAVRMLENREISDLKTRCIIYDALYYLKKFNITSERTPEDVS